MWTRSYHPPSLQPLVWSLEASALLSTNKARPYLLTRLVPHVVQEWYSGTPLSQTIEMQTPTSLQRIFCSGMDYIPPPFIITPEMWTPHYSIKWTGFTIPLVPGVYNKVYSIMQMPTCLLCIRLSTTVTWSTTGYHSEQSEAIFAFNWDLSSLSSSTGSWPKTSISQEWCMGLLSDLKTWKL